MSITPTLSSASGTHSPDLTPQHYYFDYAASAPIEPAVLEVMYSLSRSPIGNAQAKHHVFGSTAAKIVERARSQVAEAIGAQPEEIIFTSGATESNNLVLKGLASHLKTTGKTHVITNAVEHKSVLEPLNYLSRAGLLDLTILPVKPCGMIEAAWIERTLRQDTGLVSVQAVNNELGTIQPLAEIAAVLKDRGILFHTDAAQALSKIDFSAKESGIDFASLSSHKIYGPQGIGAVYAKGECANLLEATLLGGGQEYGLRSGTLPVPLCAGFGTACNLIVDDRDRMQGLRSYFLDKIRHLKPIVHGHSDANWNVPGILNVRFPGIESEALVMELPFLAFGLGSACGSGQAIRTSHVIAAITGSSEQAAREAIRLSFGRFTSYADMDAAATQIIEAVSTIKQLQGVA